MSNISLAVVCASRCDVALPTNSADEITMLSAPRRCAQNGHIAAGAGVGSTDQVPDYAARLRAAAHGASARAFISREDAMGAAAEIEQLWAAFRILGGARAASFLGAIT